MPKIAIVTDSTSYLPKPLLDQYHITVGPQILIWDQATYQDGVEFLRIAIEMGIRSTVTVYPLEEANRALLDLKQSKINGEAVLGIAN